MNVLNILLSILIPAGAVALIVFAIRRMTGHGGGGGDGQAIRRFFQYLLMLGLLVVVAIGLSGLLGRAFEGRELAATGGADLARGLTFTLVGGPLYLLLAAWSRRKLREEPEEAESFGWAFYITAASLIALVVSMFSLHRVLTWATGVESYDGGALAQLIVWGAVWAVHWVVGSGVTPEGRLLVHHLLGSLLGLGTSVTGLVGLLGEALRTLLGVEGEGVLVAGGDALLVAAVTLAVGAPVWLIYWLATAVRAERSPLWVGYTLLVGVGGGLATAIASVSTVLYQVLVWSVGDPGSDTASSHFSGVPAALAAAVVGLLVWWYHHAVLEEAEGEERTEVRRIYEYVMAGIGLLAAAGGLTTVLVAFIEAMTGAGSVTGDSSINTLLAAVTLLVVGGPVWWIYWRGIQRSLVADPAEETSSPTRRVYLFILFGVGGVAAVIALLAGVFIFFEDLFENRFGSESIRSMRFAIGVLATTGALAAYHWAIYRSDRRHGPARRQGPSYVLLVGAPDPDIAREVGRRTGGRVYAWDRLDDHARSWDVDEIMVALSTTSEQAVIVVADPAGLEVIPVDRG